MDEKMVQVAVAIGENSDLVDKLEQMLQNPGDRAYLVCDFHDCRHNRQGRCSVYTVTNPPERSGKGPCASYTV
jgi:hypothetical protein